MGQIIFIKHPTGRIGLGLFLTAVSAFLFSAFDPLFGPLAMGCLGAGVVVAGLLSRRRARTPHIDPRQVDPPPGPLHFR